MRRGRGRESSLGHAGKEKGAAKWPVAPQLWRLLPDFPGGMSPALKEQESKRLGHLGAASPLEEAWESQGRTARLRRKSTEEGMSPSLQPGGCSPTTPAPSLGGEGGLFFFFLNNKNSYMLIWKKTNKQTPQNPNLKTMHKHTQGKKQLRVLRTH